MKPELQVNLVDLSISHKADKSGEQEVLSIRLLLENFSSVPLFVISEPRCSSYDADGNRLFLGFCEPAVNDEIPPRWFSPPAFIKLEAGEKNEITVYVPRTYNQVVSSSTQLFDRVAYDLTQAEQLEVQVRYGHFPFQSLVAHAIENARKLRDWGRTVDQSFTIRK